MTTYNETSLIKLPEVIGNKKTGTQGLIPVSRTTFLNGVKSGLYPKPVSIGVRAVAWRYSEIKSCIDGMERVVS